MRTWHRAVLAENDSICCDEGQEHSVLVLRLRSQAKQPGVDADDCCQGNWAASADTEDWCTKNPSDKVMLVWEWDQKAIEDAPLQQQDAQQCDIAESACAALVVQHAMPQHAVLSDVTELSPPVSQLDSLMQISAPMTLLGKYKSRGL